MIKKDILLEVKNLVTEFKTEGEIVKAVNDISFTLHRGETIGIVGESGSGKSVTALSAMQLIPNPPGRVTSAGEPRCLCVHETECLRSLDGRRCRGSVAGER